MSNSFSIFDENSGNMMTLEEYATNQARMQGVQAGVASSSLHNRSMHQMSYAAYAIAELMSQQGYDATDNDSIEDFVNTFFQAASDFILDSVAPNQDILDMLGLPEGSSIFDVLYELATIPTNEAIVVVSLNAPDNFNPEVDVTVTNWGDGTISDGQLFYHFPANGKIIRKLYSSDGLTTTPVSKTMQMTFGVGFSAQTSLQTKFNFGSLTSYVIDVRSDTTSEFTYELSTVLSFSSAVESVDYLIIGAGGKGGNGGSGGTQTINANSNTNQSSPGTGGGGGGAGGGTGQVIQGTGFVPEVGKNYVITVGVNGGSSSAFGFTAQGGPNGRNGTSGGSGSGEGGTSGGAGGTAGSAISDGLAGGNGGAGGSGTSTQTSSYSVTSTSGRRGSNTVSTGSSKQVTYWGGSFTQTSGDGGAGGGGGSGGAVNLNRYEATNYSGNNGGSGTSSGPGSGGSGESSTSGSNTLTSGSGGVGGTKQGNGGNGGGGASGGVCWSEALSSGGYVAGGKGGSGQTPSSTRATMGSGGHGGGGGGGNGGGYYQIPVSKQTIYGGSGGTGQSTVGVVKIRINYAAS